MKIHLVKKGDTLFTIAKKYGIELQKLISFNSQITDPDSIDVGMKVKIPSSGPVSPLPPEADTAEKHVVVQGDTLWKLSKAWGIPLKTLIDANPHLKNPDVLMTGDIVYKPQPHTETATVEGEMNAELILSEPNEAAIGGEQAGPNEGMVAEWENVSVSGEEADVAPHAEDNVAEINTPFAQYSVPSLETMQPYSLQPAHTPPADSNTNASPNSQWMPYGMQQMNTPFVPETSAWPTASELPNASVGGKQDSKASVYGTAASMYPGLPGYPDTSHGAANGSTQGAGWPQPWATNEIPNHYGMPMGAGANEMPNMMPMMGANAMSNTMPMMGANAMPNMMPNMMPMMDMNAMPNMMPMMDANAMPNMMPMMDANAMPNMMPMMGANAMPNMMPMQGHEAETHAASVLNASETPGGKELSLEAQGKSGGEGDGGWQGYQPYASMQPQTLPLYMPHTYGYPAATGGPCSCHGKSKAQAMHGMHGMMGPYAGAPYAMQATPYPTAESPHSSWSKKDDRAETYDGVMTGDIDPTTMRGGEPQSQAPAEGEARLTIRTKHKPKRRAPEAKRVVKQNYPWLRT